MVEWRGQSDEPLGRMWNDLNVFFVSTDYVSRHQFGGPKLGIMKKSPIEKVIGHDTTYLGFVVRVRMTSKGFKEIVEEATSCETHLS